jgi:hypothetical protein
MSLAFWLPVIAAFVGVAVTLMVFPNTRPWGPAVLVSPPEPPAEKYGHPWAPVPELRKVLPKPPDSYVWEISVDVDQSGDYILTLGALNMLTGVTTERIQVNLTRRSYETWAKFYREYESLRRGYFENEILGPLKEWANNQTDELAGKREPGNVEYHLETGA